MHLYHLLWNLITSHDNTRNGEVATATYVSGELSKTLQETVADWCIVVQALPSTGRIRDNECTNVCTHESGQNRSAADDALDSAIDSQLFVFV